MGNDKMKLKWLDETTTWTYINKYNSENSVVCPMRDWPDDIKVKLDNLAGALDNGLKLCQDIMNDKELDNIGGGMAEWLEEKLIKTHAVLMDLVYVDVAEEKFEDDELN